MKECSKMWYKCSRHPGDNISSKYTFYSGWKAALEMVLALNSVRVCDAVYEDIKRELNAEAD